MKADLRKFLVPVSALAVAAMISCSKNNGYSNDTASATSATPTTSDSANGAYGASGAMSPSANGATTGATLGSPAAATDTMVPGDTTKKATTKMTRKKKKPY